MKNRLLTRAARNLDGTLTVRESETCSVRLLMSLCGNNDQPLPLVTARFRRSLRSRDQRERSMRTIFTQTLTVTAHCADEQNQSNMSRDREGAEAEPSFHSDPYSRGSEPCGSFNFK